MASSPQGKWFPLKWVEAMNGEIPEGALESGWETEGPLYVCRAGYGGGVHPGKVRADFGGCHIPWGGQEIVIPIYDVLVAAILGGPGDPGQDLAKAVHKLADAISRWGGSFLSDQETLTVHRAIPEIQRLALVCGCVALADAADTLGELAKDRFADRDDVTDQLDKMEDLVADCTGDHAPERPSRSWSQAATLVYELAGAIRMGSGLFLSDYEKQMVRVRAPDIRRLARVCCCTALAEGAQRLEDLASEGLPDRDEAIEELDNMKQAARDCLGGESPGEPGEMESTIQRPPEGGDEPSQEDE